MEPCYENLIPLHVIYYPALWILFSGFFVGTLTLILCSDKFHVIVSYELCFFLFVLVVFEALTWRGYSSQINSFIWLCHVDS